MPKVFKAKPVQDAATQRLAELLDQYISADPNDGKALLGILSEARAIDDSVDFASLAHTAARANVLPGAERRHSAAVKELKKTEAELEKITTELEEATSRLTARKHELNAAVSNLETDVRWAADDVAHLENLRGGHTERGYLSFRNPVVRAFAKMKGLT